MTCIVLLGADSSFSAERNAKTAWGIPVKGYEPFWSDEFNGTALDASKWAYRGLGPRKGGVNVKDTVEVDGKGHLIPGPSKGWHTFGLLWTDEEYVLYVDGKKTWRTDKAISGRSEYIILSLEVGRWAGDISQATLPDSLYGDDVRVYHKAEPEHLGGKK